MAKTKREPTPAFITWEKAKADADKARELYNKNSTEPHKAALEKARATVAERHKAVRRENFARLMNARGPVAAKALKAVSALANRNQYEYAEGDFEKVKAKLQEEFNRMCNAFEISLKSGGKTEAATEEKWV